MTGSFAGNGLFGGYLSDPQIAAEFAAEPFLDRMLRFERAWTETLLDLDVVGAEDARAALDVLTPEHLDLADLGRASERDGMPVPQMIATLTARLGERMGALHQGATSQDVIDTAMVLSLRAVAGILRRRIGTALASLERLAGRDGARDLTGYTRMQAARSIPAAARIAAWAGPLGRSDTALAHAAAALTAQIGGAVGLRDVPRDVGADMAVRVAGRLGLPAGDVWHADRAAMLGYGHALTLVTGALGKMGQDLALMAMLADGSLDITGGGTSSAMPDKQNPTGAEAMVALARFNAGLSGTLGHSAIAEMERSGAAWALEWLTLPQMAEATGCALTHAVDMLARIERIGKPD